MAIISQIKLWVFFLKAMKVKIKFSSRSQYGLVERAKMV